MRKFACFLLCTISFSIYAQTNVESLRLWRAPDHTRIVFDLSKPVVHSIFTLENPHRLVVDLDNTQLNEALISKLDKKNTPIQNIRIGSPDLKTTRIVLDVDAGVTSKSFTLQPNENYPNRLVIDLYDHKPTATPLVTQKNVQHGSRDIIIAIDAGHGGEDPGALGPNGLKEKNIVFSIAKKLYNRLEKEKGFKPVMIRTGDYYVGLRKRTQLAREKNADLFVSIHADAFHNKKANGASVFVLSERGATSETGRWLAKKENRADLIGGVSNVSLGDKDDLLAGVLLDLSMTATLDASFNVGKKVLSSLSTVNRLHKQHVEQAGFAVLKSPDIPSILVETGFISNPSESKNLASSSHQNKLASAILKGILAYFSHNPPPGTFYAKNN